MFILDATSLTRYQQCRRRYLLDRSWQVLRWRPRSLYSHCIREAVFAISQGRSPEDAITLARATFMSQAANPGLDASVQDTYTLASDYCSMIGTSLLAISRGGIPRLQRANPIALSPALSWRPASFYDDSGALHRWISVDTWNADTISRELHSWHTIGDMAVCDAPLTLHVIIIGQGRNGRLQSPWCRGYAHPMIAGRIRFQSPPTKSQPKPRRLQGEQWRPVWLSDLQVSPAEWLQRLDADAVTPSLLSDGEVKQPSAEAAADVLQQIVLEGTAMQALVESKMEKAMSVPMSRPACDGIVRCPFQESCFVERPTEDLTSLGLYRRRSNQDEIGADASASSDQLQPALRST